MRNTISSLFFILILCISISLHSEELYFIDVHSQVDEGVQLDSLIQAMDAADIQTTILAARGKRTNRDVLDWAAEHPQRILPSIRTKGGAYMKDRPKYYKNIARQAQSGRFSAMAELLLYHAPKGDFAPEVIVHPDDRRISAALDAIREYEWPLILHIEFSSLSPSSKKQFHVELEKLLKDNPQHPFALNHMGQLSAEEVKSLINNHPNIYFLTAHSNTIAVNRSNQPWVNMFAGNELAPAWRELVISHPERFIFAVDNVLSKHWKHDYTQQLDLWRKALSNLPVDVAHAIAHANAERLWKLH